MPLSGILDGHPNDVVLKNGWRVEVKGRSRGLSLIYGWMEEADVVAFRETGQDWLFAMGRQRFTLWADGDLSGWRGAMRRILSRLDPAGPVIVLPDRSTMVCRERRSGFSTIRRWLAAEKADALLFRGDRREWLVVLDRAHLEALLGNSREAESARKTLHV